MTDEPLYYAKGNEVWKRPIETPREGGGKTISIGFKVCTCTDVVGLKGAETVAKMLSLAEGHPDAYRHGWEDREADLIDGAKRVLSAPSSPGDGWEPRPSTGGQAAIIDGKIEISIDVAALPMIVNGSCCCDSMEGLWKVTDAETFAKEVCRALNDEREDGTTRVHMMFDAAFMEAINQGAEGVEEVDEEAFGDETARLMAHPLPAAPSPGGDHEA